MTETTLYPIEVIQGVEGLCIGLNNYRIVGPKPWGGGSVVKRWDVSVDDLKRAIPELATIDALTTENATLKAALESIVSIGRLENYADLLASGERITFSPELRETAAQVLAGKEAQSD